MGYRLFLYTQYFGWEESDYGNLAMVKGVVDHGFLNYDMNHLPMYYFLSAVVMSLVGSSTVAAVSVSMCFGVLTVLLGFLLTDRIAGRRAAWTVGLLLVFQPELALYSASSLREPVYAAAVLGTLLALANERLALASLVAGVAFLTRMDAFPILLPVLILHALGRPNRISRVIKAVAPLVISVLGWSIYCKLHPEYQTFAFWSHSVAVNLETGGAQGGETLGAWVASGTAVAGGLFVKVLSGRMGLGIWFALIVGMIWTPWNRHSARRTVAFSALLLMGFWLTTGFLAQHELGHNLYWKWLHGPLPVLFVVAVPVLWTSIDRMTPALGWMGSRALMVLVMLQAILQMGGQTQSQLAQSEKVNRPQLELARWIEAETAEDAVLILDNIPERWLSRRDHDRRFLSWMDLSECPEQGGACEMTALTLGNLLFKEGVSYVLWFKERWTMGPVAAPYLGGADMMDLGKVSLKPLRMDRIDEVDGWVFYEVVAQAL